MKLAAVRRNWCNIRMELNFRWNHFLFHVSVWLIAGFVDQDPLIE